MKRKSYSRHNTVKLKLPDNQRHDVYNINNLRKYVSEPPFKPHPIADAQAPKRANEIVEILENNETSDYYCSSHVLQIWRTKLMMSS